jgi:hypothetical protein
MGDLTEGAKARDLSGIWFKGRAKGSHRCSEAGWSCSTKGPACAIRTAATVGMERFEENICMSNRIRKIVGSVTAVSYLSAAIVASGSTVAFAEVPSRIPPPPGGVINTTGWARDRGTNGVLFDPGGVLSPGGAAGFDLPSGVAPDGYANLGGYGGGGGGGPFASLLGGGGAMGNGGLLQNFAFLGMLLALFQGSNTQQSAGTALSNLSSAEQRVGGAAGAVNMPGGAGGPPSAGGNSSAGGNANGGGSSNNNGSGSNNGNGQTGQWGSVGNRNPGNGNGSTSGGGTSGNTGGSSTVGTSGGEPAGGGSTAGSGSPNGGAGGSGSPGTSGGATGTWGAVGSSGASGSASQSSTTQNDPSASKPADAPPAAPPSGSTGGVGAAPGTNSSGGGGNLPTGSFFPRGYTNPGM